MARALPVLCFLAASLGVPVRAGAQCEETTPVTGVVLLRCMEPGLRWAVVRADLAAADVGVRVSRPEERQRTVEEWTATVPGALAAVQGGPFAFPSYSPVGLTVGTAETWPDGRDDARLGVLALDERGVGLVVAAEQVVPSEPWMHQVVSGSPVLRSGTVVEPCAQDGCEPAPRSAVGLGDDGRTLVLVAVEGWTADSAGVTDPELGELALAAGAEDALRTGDGATSLLWMRDAGAVVPSSDGVARPTAAFLGLFDRASGVEGRLRGIVKRAADPMDPLPAATIRVETIDGRLIVESGTMTTGAYFEHTLPAREYFVKASLTGYRTACKFCPLPAGGELWCSLFLTEGAGEESCDAPPRVVDAGPWPVGSLDAGVPDAGEATPDAGDPPIEGGCAAAGPGRGPGGGAPALLASLFVLAIAARRKVRRRG